MLKKAQVDIATLDTGSAIIKIENVTKTFKQWQRGGSYKNILKNLIKPQKKTITALDNISLEIKKGEFVAYAGANGAGKSTTMKLLSGMLLPECGDISVMNYSPQKDRIQLMNRLGVMFGNRTELWWDHPIIQSFEWKKVVWDIPKERYERNKEMVTELLDLGGILNTFARELSLGQRMRADLALMLLHSPEVILLDEPTLGLDVLAKRNMIDFLKRVNRENDVTVVVTSHDMDDLEEMAERIILLSNGKIAYDGNFDDLRIHTGAYRTIKLTTDDEIVLDLTHAKLIKSNDGIHDYEIDPSVNISKLLKEISIYDNIIDIETGKTPIEEVIANLYTSWK